MEKLVGYSAELERRMIKGMFRVLKEHEVDIQVIIEIYDGCLKNVYLFGTKGDAEKAYEKLIMDSGEYKSVIEYKQRIKNRNVGEEVYWVIERLGRCEGEMMAKKKQITAKDLLDKYECDVAELQKICKHKKVSDWLVVREIHGNDTGVKYKQCEICWAKLEYKAPCEACKKEYTYEDGARDWTASQLCPKCMKKGKYYCWTHKQIHRKPQGCPICIKSFEAAEKRDKRDKKQKAVK